MKKVKGDEAQAMLMGNKVVIGYTKLLKMKASDDNLSRSQWSHLFGFLFAKNAWMPSAAQQTFDSCLKEAVKTFHQFPGITAWPSCFVTGCVFDLCSLNYFAHVPINGMIESGEPFRRGREITLSLDTSWEGAGKGIFRDTEYGRWENQCMELRAATWRTEKTSWGPCSLGTS